MQLPIYFFELAPRQFHEFHPDAPSVHWMRPPPCLALTALSMTWSKDSSCCLLHHWGTKQNRLSSQFPSSLRWTRSFIKPALFRGDSTFSWRGCPVPLGGLDPKTSLVTHIGQSSEWSLVTDRSPGSLAWPPQGAPSLPGHCLEV